MEKIRTYDQGMLFKAGKFLNNVRTNALEQDISLKGRRSSGLKEEQNTAVFFAEGMQKKHKDWLDTKFAPLLPYLQKKTEYTVDEVTAKVQDEYIEGLRTAITIHSRAADNNTFDTQDAIASYTTGFITMLRVCERFDVHPNTAVVLAKKNYLLEGGKVAQLFRENDDIPSSTIEHAAIYHPRDPKGFLENYSKAVQWLSTDERFQDFSQSTIERAVLYHPTDPEGYLENYSKTVERLSADKRFERIPKSTIERAVLYHPTDPEGFLDKQK